VSCGWEDVGVVVVEEVREERSVSCRPGTEGAPRSRVVEGDLVVVLVVLVAWEG
jgi:hypothetical protein